jgi:hypothetical protein
LRSKFSDVEGRCSCGGGLVLTNRAASFASFAAALARASASEAAAAMTASSLVRSDSADEVA